MLLSLISEHASAISLVLGRKRNQKRKSLYENNFKLVCYLSFREVHGVYRVTERREQCGGTSKVQIFLVDTRCARKCTLTWFTTQSPTGVLGSDLMIGVYPQYSRISVSAYHLFRLGITEVTYRFNDIFSVA